MNLIYEAGHIVSHAFFDLFYAGEISGTEWIPPEGPFIIAANHVSFLDPPAIGCRVPREMCYFARKTLFKPGLPNWFLHKVNTVPVDLESDSDISSLKTVFRLLKEGNGILLFPEGTRTYTGELLPAQPGVGMIACKSRAPIIPTRIFGAFEAYGRHQRLPRLNIPIDVAFTRPITYEEYGKIPGRGKERYQVVSELIMEAISKIPPPPRVEV